MINEGIDPITGKETKSWHAAGTDRAEAEALARRPAAERDGRNDEIRTLTFGAYLTGRWLQRRLSINRGLVAVGDELHESRGRSDNSRRCINLDPTTPAVPAGWRSLQAAEHTAVGIDDHHWMFTTATGEPVHPHTLSQTFDRIARPAPAPVIRRHDLRHTHGTILIANGVHPKVVSERLGHAWFAFTVETYHTCSPAWVPTPPASSKHSSRPPPKTPRRKRPVEHPGEHHRNPGEHPTNNESPGL